MSEHWLRKMRTYFKRIDFDGDGKITRADFEGMAKRFADTGHLKEDASKTLFDTLTAVWDKYLSAVGTPDAPGIDQKTFIAAITKLKSDAGLKPTLQGPLPHFFRAVDLNADGFISHDEYKDFFGILGLDKGLAEASFKAIDTDGDNLLSEKEFVDAGSDFFLNDSEGPNSFFWGSLV
jgi:Ca2+-binding EF-hand superfamily protein